MNKKIIVTVKLSLLFIISTTVLSANAEESVVQVPFDSTGQSCTFNELAIEYQCIWEYTQDPFTLEDLEEFKHLLSEELYASEVARLTPITPPPVPQLTADEKIIKELTIKLDSGIATAADATLLRLLGELDTCQQGLGNSSAIQEQRSVETSSYAVNQWNNLDAKMERLGVLLRAIQECNAQQILENQILSPAYKHFADANKAGGFDHLSMLADQAVPYDKLTATTTDIDMSVICDSNAHVQAYKDLMGCPPIQYQGFTYPEGNGFITYYSPILEEYGFFMQDYGNKIATEKDKRLQELVAIPIANAWKENHQFYQNSIRD